MTLTIKRTPGDKVLELGGGNNPLVRPNADVRPGPLVDFVVDFDGSVLPFPDGEWDCVVSHFALEHVSWRNVIPFLQEVFRIVKPGGMAVFAVPNTEAQFHWALNNPAGWDGKGPFESISEVIFGSQDYPENYHKCFFSPGIVEMLFTAVGFGKVDVKPYGERATDMVISAVKTPKLPGITLTEEDRVRQEFVENRTAPTRPTGVSESIAHATDLMRNAGKDTPREELFDKHYFNGGGKFGGYAREGYWDYPVHQITFRHVMARQPKSVLEIGCLVAGSPIITDRGVLPIELVEDGMQVYTHEGQLSKVSRMSTRPYSGEVVVIEPRYSRGLPLKLTPDHPVFAIRVERQFKSWKPDLIGKPEWVPASELGVDTHWLVYPKPKQKETLEVDSDYARLCGYYLSQGWCQKKWNGSSTGYVVSFCFNEKHRDYAEDVRDLMKRYFGTTDGWIEGGTGKAFKISFYSKSGFFQLSGTFGRGARNKTIPMEWVVGASSEALKQLVLGMYRGDGAKTSDRFDYCTASVSMAVSLRMVMMRLGIFTELASQEGKDSEIGGRVIAATRSYHVRAAGSQAVAAGAIVGIQFRASSDGRSYWFGREDADFFYVPIKRLTREEFDGAVFNMDVEEDHSYSHPVGTVHNCARGYILKRLQDAGVPAVGIEISKHCYLTRACDGIFNLDVCGDRWTDYVMGEITPTDLAFSIATFEHIPEEHLPGVLYNLKKYTRRGLHGIDFGEKDDGFDKTHCSLHPKSWWRELFDKHGLQDHEIVDKEELEQGTMPKAYLEGDGKVKLNIGSFTVMYHNGWENIDVADLQQYAQHHGYRYRRHDVRNGLPHGTASVDLISCSHMLEHLTYDEGKKFLAECRRVLKPGGVIRVAVPDAELLLSKYADDTLGDFAEINEVCGQNVTRTRKLHSLLYDNHQATYDADTLRTALHEADFRHEVHYFRQGHKQIQAECLDMFPCLSLYAEGTF